MNVEELISHIQERIRQTQQWAADGLPGEISGFAIRKYHCIAKPVGLRPDPSRRESFGIVFRLFWEGPSGKSFAEVDVRLNPEGSMSQDGEVRTHKPYYAVYLPALPGTHGLVSWKEFPADMDTQVPLAKFFRRILAAVCREEHCAKIFGVKQKLPD